MATRLWESLVGRRGSNAEDLFDESDQASQGPSARRSSSQVHTLGAMKGKANSLGGESTSSMSSSANGTASAASDGSQHSSPDQKLAAHPPSRSASVQSDKAPEKAAKSFQQAISPFSAAAEPNKVSGSTNHSIISTGPASGADQHHEGSDAGEDFAHDSASSTCDGSKSAGHLSRRHSSNSKAHVPAASAPAGPTAAAQDAALAAASDTDRTLSLSLGFSDHMPGSNLASVAVPAAISTSAHQHSDMSFVPSTQALNAAGFSSGAVQQPGSATPTDGSTPRLSSPSGLGLGLFSTPLDTESIGLGAGMFGLQGLSSVQAGGAGYPMEAMIAELQATAGLTAEQAAAAAAVMMPRMGTPPVSPLAQLNSFQTSTATAHNPWAHSPPGQGCTMPPPLSPMSPMALHPGSNPDLGAAGFLAMGAQGELLGSPVAALGAAGAFGGPLMGFDSVHSSSSNNVVMSGTGFGLMGGPTAGGMLSPENSFLAEAAQYAHDGLDVPGTAQVAVHNVPFKWCNIDLEELFKQQEGYLDAQLLFHENGRSKGVGVGLFRDRGCAVEACNKLSGAQADGRKLELVLMNPDNHVSFSCRQVAVLGLPWEYTSADVRALLEAAAEADGAAPAEAGVEHVEVAYRDDGKSEGRAIATFASRRTAHDAIRRLHGKETLAGLRMRLFYLHEQQQTRNQNVLAQLQTRQQLLPSLIIPGMDGLALGTSTLSPMHPASMANTPLGANTSQQQLFSNGNGSGEVVSAGEVSSGQNAEQQGQMEGEGAASGGEGAVSGAQAEGRAGEGDVLVGSGRSSLEKDQGPVILHVSGLMESVTREQLRELFSQAGEVTKVDIPDGGRSMGYGFITFSNPQAAEQAMLLFNNYPLGGGAIHVAYSTSATAKARQQALRQARKATLGNSSASTDGGPGRQPNTPRSLAAAGGRRGPGVNSFPSPNPSLGGLGGSFGGLDNLNPGRRSFDIQGYPGSLGGAWPRGPAGLSPGMGGLGGISTSLGALAGTPPGMHAAAIVQGRNRRNSFEYGMGLLGGPSALQMLQGAGGSAGYPAGLAGGFDVSTAGNLDQQLQLLMQMTGTAGDPNAFAAAAGGLMGMSGGQPGTPPPGGLRSPMGAGNAGGLFSPPMSAAAAFGGMPGLSTPPGAFMGGPGPGGVFGGSSATAAAGQGSLFAPPNNMMGGGRPGVGAMMAGSLGIEGQQGGMQRQVLVTGLPPGLTDGDLRALFEICGPLRSVNKQHDQDFAIITYDTVEHAHKAISVLNGTKLPSGTTLSLQFLDLRSSMMPDTPAKTSDMTWSPALSPSGMYGAGAGGGVHSAFATGLATPPRGSFAGEGAGVIGSGSLFPVAEAGNTGELFGGAYGGNMGGMGHMGGFGSVGSGLRVGATSPAFGRPPRDGAGPAVASTSALYSPTPMRSVSPGVAAGMGGIAGRIGSGVQSGAGLPPVYSGSAGIANSASAGSLFGRGVGGEGGIGSDGASATGSDGGHA